MLATNVKIKTLASNKDKEYLEQKFHSLEGYLDDLIYHIYKITDAERTVIEESLFKIEADKNLQLF